MVIFWFEVVRVVEQLGVFLLCMWNEIDDLIGLVADLAGTALVAVIGDYIWVCFLVDLYGVMVDICFVWVIGVIGLLRMVKDDVEIDWLVVVGVSSC